MTVEKITLTPTPLGVVDKVNEIIDNLGTGSGVELQSIAVTTPPNQTNYATGQTFDPSGMVITAYYAFDLSQVVTGYTVTPTVLTDGVTEVVIKYSEGGTTVETTQAVTVIPGIARIAVTTNPTKTTYEYGDTFSSSGMVVTGTYTNGTSKTVTGWTTSPSALTTIGTQAITVSYTEDGITAKTTLNITVNRKSIVIPTQSNSLTYTGSAQYPTWNNYDSGKMTLGGTTSGTNAGNYTATFTPGDNYRWSDGATTAKSVTWSIGKATGLLRVSPASTTVTPDEPTETITITKTGNGTLSISSSNEAAVTATISGTTITVTRVADGSATITVTMADSTNYTGASATCEVASFSVTAVFADATWEEVISACWNGTIPSTWAIGDSKTMSIGGTDYAIDIIGKHHDEYSDGSGTAPLTFQFHDCYGTKYAMNSSGTNSGGYDASEMHTTHLPEILTKMPAEIRAAIQPVNKMASAGSQSTNIETIPCNLFLLAEIEIFGETSYSVAGEGSQYAYYSAGNSTVKKYNGASNYWWERSPYSGDSNNFCRVYNDGYAEYAYASTTTGVAPAFCFASNPIKSNFADTSWAGIAKACRTNAVPSTWNVGDSKAMNIGGTDYMIDIIGKNHDVFTDGSGTAPLTFQFHDCYGTKYAMNSTNTNSGGYDASEMHTTHLPAILALMPAEVQAAIKPVNKMASVGDRGTDIETFSCDLFLLAEIEVFGSITHSVAGEGSQYAYYSAGNSTKKNVNGSAFPWWERSPRSGSLNYFCAVSNGGNADNYYPSYTRGVAPAFCFEGNPYDPTLSNNTWEEIAEACQNDEVPATWDIGDSKTMLLDNVEYQIDIIGKNHDTYTAGGTAPLTFQFHDCYNTLSAMNNTETNVGGYGATVMHTTTLPNILSLMPAEVRVAIKAVDKKTSAGNTSTTIETISCELFLLAEIELFGEAIFSVAGEGTQYAYYSAGNSKVKKYQGSKNNWWDRSPHSNRSDWFCFVTSGGFEGYAGSSAACGVAPAFCLGGNGDVEIITFQLDVFDEVREVQYVSTEYAIKGMTTRDWMNSKFSSNISWFCEGPDQRTYTLTETELVDGETYYAFINAGGYSTQ